MTLTYNSSDTVWSGISLKTLHNAVGEPTQNFTAYLYDNGHYAVLRTFSAQWEIFFIVGFMNKATLVERLDEIPDQ